MIIDVYKDNIIEEKTPKIIIQYMKVPSWNPETEKTNYYHGIIVRHTINQEQIVFYPDDHPPYPTIALINHLLLLKNKDFNHFMQECYVLQDDILLIDPDGKRKIIAWYEYEFIFAKCNFYQTKKEAKIETLK